MKALTQERLMKLLKYDPATGIFTRKVKSSSRTKTGEMAGSKHCGYIRITIDYKSYQAHKLAFLYMHGYIPEGAVDHIDHNKSNNAWDNLRQVSHQENSRNYPRYKNNTSGTNGISWHKRDCKWTASIYVDGKKIYLGSFKYKKDAIDARIAANSQYGFHRNHGKVEVA